jgi:DNA-binding IclR family transcriptional regulator
MVSAVQKPQADRPVAEPGQEPAYPIASVNNALRLLLLFRRQPRVRLSEASEHLGVAHSTAHRLLAMLAYHGFVRQEPDSRAYIAGPALVEIGLAAVSQLDIRRHARPALERLAGTLGETAHLAVLEGGNVRYLDAVESSRALRVASRTGSVLAASCTASGKALLAALPEAEVSAMFADREALPRLTPRSITSRPALLAELRQVRADGCAVNREESEEGVVSVAVAVRGPRPAPGVALTVSAPVSRMTEEATARIKEELRAQAAWLAAQLPGAT